MFAFELLKPVDRTNIRMIQRREQFCFALESGETIGVRVKLFRQRFDGDASIESSIARSIDLPHASLAEQGNDFMGTELSTNGQGHVSQWIIEQRRLVA